MKSILTLTLTLAFSVAGFAEEPKKVVKEDCKKCDVPTRAAVLAGTATVVAAAEGAKKCSAECSKECAKECAKASATACAKGCASTATAYVVKGLTCGGCSDKVKAALAKVEGVKVNGVCHKSGHVSVNFDSDKICPTKVIAAIDSTGFKVTGQQVSYKLTGLTCAGCSSAVEKVLAKTEGVTKVNGVCHKSGHATVIIDPAKTCPAKVAAALDQTKFKVAKDG